MVVVVAACTAVQTTQPGAIGVDRKQYMAVSEEQVEQGAVEAYKEELNKAKSNNALNTDKAAVARVRAIADRLIPQTVIFRQDAKSWDWQVNVETSKEVNAYCMPGGKIMVYTGLIDQLKVTDDELAAVIGHEMGHALREHSRERVSRQYGQQLVLAGVAAVTGAGDAGMQLAGMVSNVTFTLPHSREQEAEADRIGLELMARAGYNPQAAMTLWKKMGAAGGGGGPEFLSTHPSDQSRLKDIEKNIPRVLPLYQAARKK